MPDFSKLAVENGTVYDVKDAQARAMIDTDHTAMVRMYEAEGNKPSTINLATGIIAGIGDKCYVIATHKWYQVTNVDSSTGAITWTALDTGISSPDVYDTGTGVTNMNTVLLERLNTRKDTHYSGIFLYGSNNVVLTTLNESITFGGAPKYSMTKIYNSSTQPRYLLEVWDDIYGYTTYTVIHVISGGTLSITRGVTGVVTPTITYKEATMRGTATQTVMPYAQIDGLRDGNTSRDFYTVITPNEYSDTSGLSGPLISLWHTNGSTFSLLKSDVLGSIKSALKTLIYLNGGNNSWQTPIGLYQQIPNEGTGITLNAANCKLGVLVLDNLPSLKVTSPSPGSRSVYFTTSRRYALLTLSSDTKTFSEYLMYFDSNCDGKYMVRGRDNFNNTIDSSFDVGDWFSFGYGTSSIAWAGIEGMLTDIKAHIDTIMAALTSPSSPTSFYTFVQGDAFDGDSWRGSMIPASSAARPALRTSGTCQQGRIFDISISKENLSVYDLDGNYVSFPRGDGYIVHMIVQRTFRHDNA